MENELIAKIEKDYIDAYKKREELKISVLRLIKSAIKNEEIRKREALTEDDITAVLRREAKQRKESVFEFRRADKTEAAEREELELSIIEFYLPKQLSENEVRDIVIKTIKELGIENESQIGKLMGAIMSKYGNSIDGGLVSKTAREVLQK